MKISTAKNPLDKLTPGLKKELDRNLCVCNEVLTMDIINAILNGAATVEEVKKQTYATDGIGCCTQQVKLLIECLCTTEKKIKRDHKGSESIEIGSRV